MCNLKIKKLRFRWMLRIWKSLGGTAPLTKNDSLYLKIVNTFVQIMSRPTSLSKLSNIGILVGQAIFKLWIKTVNIFFWSITQELLAYLHSNPNLTVGWVGKVQKKLSRRRKEGWVEKKSTRSAPAGPAARTRDLPRARRGSPAARHGGC